MKVAHSITLILTLTATRADTEPASACDSSAPPVPRPRLTIKLGPPPVTVNSKHVEGNSYNPPIATRIPVPTHDHTSNTQGPVSTPPDAASRNLRLEHAQAALSKKRKPLVDDKVPTTSTKKQKSSPDMLAILPADNSIRWGPFHFYICRTNNYYRSVCMRNWNEHQPGGQGLAADFEVYYKNLSEAERQVHFHTYNSIHLTLRSIALQKGNVCHTGCKREQTHLQ